MRARSLRLGIWLLCALAVAAALQFLAYWQLRSQLVREAVAVLSPLARGDTPYRWHLGDPDQLVGRRALGDCDVAFDAGELVLRRDSRLCEIGISLRAPLDLRRFGTLTVTGTTTLPVFTVQLRERLSSPQHLATVPAGAALPIELATLSWRLDADGIADVPQRAAMLRLRFADLGTDLRLREIALQSQDPGAWRPSDAAGTAWAALDTDAPLDPQRLPLFWIDGLRRPEAVLRARDELREREPAAIVVFRDDIRQVAEALANPAPAPDIAELWVLTLVVMALLAAATWMLRHRRIAAALQALLALAVPAWLVVGLHVGNRLDAGDQALIGCATLYAVILARNETARPWSWLGTRHGWLYALTAPLIAAAIAAGFGRIDAGDFPFAAIPGYLLWALLQQYLICVVVVDRLRASGLPGAWSVLVAAAAFSLLHAPNAALMLATFLGGLIWTALWLRERSLAAQAVSHALAALLLTSSLPPHWLRSAEVSLRYYL